MYEIRAEVYGVNVEFRSETEVRAYLQQHTSMPAHLIPVALARWQEKRSGRKSAVAPAPPTTEELRQKLNVQLAREDQQRRAQVEALGKEIRDAGDGESDDELQGIKHAMDELYSDSPDYEFVGATEDAAFCMDNDTLYTHKYVRVNGVVAFGAAQRLRLSQEEVSSLRKQFPALEAAQLRHAEKMKYRFAR
jgi:hypothetical protein